MATTFTKIASVSVGLLGASSIDFTSIPSTYTDLVLKLCTKTTGTSTYDSGNIGFNGLTTNLAFLRVLGSGSAASSGSGTGTIQFRTNGGAAGAANVFGNADIYMTNYAGSTYKSVSNDSVNEYNGTEAYAGLFAGLWSSTAAITTVNITPNNGVWAQYSTAVLYGINKS